MQDIRRQFIKSSTETLSSLREVLQVENNVSETFVGQIYRHIHTVKGTAQTFGLDASANLAHFLENILSSANNKLNEKQKNLLTEGLDYLNKSLEDETFQIPPSFTEKILEFAPETETVRGIYLSVIPPEVFEQLTEFEKNKITTALSDNRKLYRIDVSFGFDNFSDDFKSLQELIKEKGEIIFTLPSDTNGAGDEIGFQIYLSSGANADDMQKNVAGYNAKVILQTAQTAFSNDLRGILSQITKQGKKWAEKSGKDVKVAILADEPDLSAENTKLIFDIILHLVKNSIDHSIEEKGKIDVRISDDKDNLQITVTDDGSGVNLEKVRAKAIEKNLILPDTPLSEQEILELIYLPGFSTAEKITETSGRGIGLDAVRDSVLNAGGTIGIETRKGAGTTFEISFPIKK